MSDPTDLFSRTRARPDPAEAERLDARWRELHERHGEGEPLNAEETAFLAEHVASDPEVRAEQALFAALARTGGGAGADDDAVIEGVLGRFETGRPAPVALPVRSRAPVVAAIGLLAAAGIAALFWWPRAPAPQEPAAIARTQAPAPTATIDDATPPQAEPPASVRGVVVVSSGAFVGADGRPRKTGAELGDETVTSVENACLRVDESEACVSAETELRLVHAGEGLVATLERGDIDVRARVTATTIVVKVAGARVESPSASRYVIVMETAYRWTVSVESGRVRVIDEDSATTELDVGESHTFGERVGVELTAAQWVAKARARRSAGDAKGAIAAYEQLVERHPNHAAARTAMVTLGQLHLDLREPRPALKWFDRYLARPGGPLAEDAAYGRIRALGALGRSADERAAIDEFLASYPASSYAAKLRDR